jgi:hypothetical protein
MGMHVRTFDRLLRTILECEQRRDEALYDYVKRYSGCFGTSPLWTKD